MAKVQKTLEIRWKQHILTSFMSHTFESLVDSQWCQWVATYNEHRLLNAFTLKLKIKFLCDVLLLWCCHHSVNLWQIIRRWVKLRFSRGSCMLIVLLLFVRNQRLLRSTHAYAQKRFLKQWAVLIVFVLFSRRLLTERTQFFERSIFIINIFVFASELSDCERKMGRIKGLETYCMSKIAQEINIRDEIAKWRR